MSAADDPNDTERGASLGEMMRYAREQRDLSIEDLARSLRLEPRIIVHLENNQFDQLPAPAFTRGYVRSIAKELNIDSAPLLSDLDLRFAAEPPALADFESRAPTQITSESTIIRYTTLALVVVLLVMVALWWRAKNDVPAHDELPGEAGTSIGPATAPLDYEFATVVHPDDVYFQLDADTLPAASSGLETVASAEPADEVDSEPAPAAEKPELQIETSEDAWVEVRDALGARLYYNLVRPGQKLRLDGQPPYALTIGNSPAVNVTYAGEPIALEPHSKDGIARLELGGDGPAR